MKNFIYSLSDTKYSRYFQIRIVEENCHLPRMWNVSALIVVNICIIDTIVMKSIIIVMKIE